MGTIDSFFDAHQDLISALPIFNLYNRAWPIFSQQLNSPPAKFVRDAKGNLGTTIDSIVSLGTLNSGGHLERSVVGSWCVIDSGAAVVDTVVFDRVRIGPNAVVRRGDPRQGRRDPSTGRRWASTTTTTAPAASP